MYTAQHTTSKLKLIIKSASALLLGLLIFYSFSHRVNAQTQLPLEVAPARQQITIDPGKSATSYIKFYNHSNAAISGFIRVVDFIVKGSDGFPIFLETSQTVSSRYAAASWIKLPYDRSSIAANNLIKVQFNVSAPKDALPGGHYVAIMFEQSPYAITPEQTPVKEGIMATSPRIVGLTYIKVSGPVTEAALVTQYKVPNFVEYGPIPVVLEISNRGDYHITPRGQVSLYNWFGKKVATTIIDQKNIFPEASRIYNEKVGNKWLLGKYKVTFEAAYGEGGKALVASAFVWAFPIKVIIVLVLSIILIVLLVMIIWKKVKGKQTKLEEKLEEEIGEIESLKKKYEDAVTNSPETKK